MPNYVDQIGHAITLEGTPQRIISLVPSQTELLYDLGIGERVVGITKFCIHPNEWFKSKPRVGGTKDFVIERIRRLKPDLILANKEENRKEDIETLQQEFPVWTSDIITIQDAIEMIEDVVRMVGVGAGADFALHSSQEAKAGAGAEGLKDLYRKPLTTLGSALYLIWNDPFMVVGAHTFIHHMMEFAGFENALKLKDSRYPELSIDQLQEISPEYLLLSSEPFPFKEKHQAPLQEALPNTRVILVDGEMFSWYGSRMRLAHDYFQELHSSL